jgi:uncharacterized protein HemX
MSDIERELREALQRKQPPDGFDHRVMERAALSRRSKGRGRQWIPAAIAAFLLISVSGAYWQRQRQAARAKEQLMQALQITGQTLTLVERVAAKNLGKQER